MLCEGCEVKLDRSALKVMWRMPLSVPVAGVNRISIRTPSNATKSVSIVPK